MMAPISSGEMEEPTSEGNYTNTVALNLHCQNNALSENGKNHRLTLFHDSQAPERSSEKSSKSIGTSLDQLEDHLKQVGRIVSDTLQTESPFRDNLNIPNVLDGANNVTDIPSQASSWTPILNCTSRSQDSISAIPLHFDTVLTEGSTGDHAAVTLVGSADGSRYKHSGLRDGAGRCQCPECGPRVRCSTSPGQQLFSASRGLHKDSGPSSEISHQFPKPADMQKTSASYDALRVQDLKKLLEVHSLPISGKKSDLIARLTEYNSAQVLAPTSVPTARLATTSGLRQPPLHSDLQELHTLLQPSIHQFRGVSTASDTARTQEMAKMVSHHSRQPALKTAMQALEVVLELLKDPLGINAGEYLQNLRLSKANTTARVEANLGEVTFQMLQENRRRLCESKAPDLLRTTSPDKSANDFAKTTQLSYFEISCGIGSDVSKGDKVQLWDHLTAGIRIYEDTIRYLLGLVGNEKSRKDTQNISQLSTSSNEFIDLTKTSDTGVWSLLNGKEAPPLPSVEAVIPPASTEDLARGNTDPKAGLTDALSQPPLSVGVDIPRRGNVPGPDRVEEPQNTTISPALSVLSPSSLESTFLTVPRVAAPHAAFTKKWREQVRKPFTPTWDRDPTWGSRTKSPVLEPVGLEGLSSVRALRESEEGEAQGLLNPILIVDYSSDESHGYESSEGDNTIQSSGDSTLEKHQCESCKLSFSEKDDLFDHRSAQHKGEMQQSDAQTFTIDMDLAMEGSPEESSISTPYTNEGAYEQTFPESLSASCDEFNPGSPTIENFLLCGTKRKGSPYSPMCSRTLDSEPPQKSMTSVTPNRPQKRLRGNEESPTKPTIEPYIPQYSGSLFSDYFDVDSWERSSFIDEDEHQVDLLAISDNELPAHDQNQGQFCNASAETAAVTGRKKAPDRSVCSPCRRLRVRCHPDPEHPDACCAKCYRVANPSPYRKGGKKSTKMRANLKATISRKKALKEVEASVATDRCRDLGQDFSHDNNNEDTRFDLSDDELHTSAQEKAYRQFAKDAMPVAAQDHVETQHNGLSAFHLTQHGFPDLGGEFYAPEEGDLEADLEAAFADGGDFDALGEGDLEADLEAAFAEDTAAGAKLDRAEKEASDCSAQIVSYESEESEEE
jgi:SAP domain